MKLKACGYISIFSVIALLTIGCDPTPTRIVAAFPVIQTSPVQQHTLNIAVCPIDEPTGIEINCTVQSKTEFFEIIVDFSGIPAGQYKVYWYDVIHPNGTYDNRSHEVILSVTAGESQYACLDAADYASGSLNSEPNGKYKCRDHGYDSHPNINYSIIVNTITTFISDFFYAENPFLYGGGINFVTGSRLPIDVLTAPIIDGWFLFNGIPNAGLDLSLAEHATRNVASLCMGTVDSVVNDCATHSGTIGDTCGDGMGNQLRVICDQDGWADQIFLNFEHLEQDSEMVVIGQPVYPGSTLARGDTTGNTALPRVQVTASINDFAFQGGIPIPINCLDWNNEVIDPTCQASTTAP